MNTRSPLFLSFFVIVNLSVGLFISYLMYDSIEIVIRAAMIMATIGVLVVFAGWLLQRKKRS